MKQVFKEYVTRGRGTYKSNGRWWCVLEPPSFPDGRLDRYRFNGDYVAHLGVIYASGIVEMATFFVIYGELGIEEGIVAKLERTWMGKYLKQFYVFLLL